MSRLNTGCNAIALQSERSAVSAVASVTLSEYRSLTIACKSSMSLFFMESLQFVLLRIRILAQGLSTLSPVLPYRSKTAVNEWSPPFRRVAHERRVFFGESI